jgi:hypothetical protein
MARPGAAVAWARKHSGPRCTPGASGLAWGAHSRAGERGARLLPSASRPAIALRRTRSRLSGCATPRNIAFRRLDLEAPLAARLAAQRGRGARHPGSAALAGGRPRPPGPRAPGGRGGRVLRPDVRDVARGGGHARPAWARDRGAPHSAAPNPFPVRAGLPLVPRGARQASPRAETGVRPARSSPRQQHPAVHFAAVGW